MKRLLIVGLLLLLFIVGLIGVRFSSALFQEENTVEILAAIVKLEFSDHYYVIITDGDAVVRLVSKTSNWSQGEIIGNFMSVKEWEFVDQMGSGYFFEKGEETVVVGTRLYTKHYFLWDVPREVFD